MTKLGLTAAQGHILIYILEHPEEEVYSTEIHQEIGVTRGTVSGLIKKLRAKGYLEFQSCAGDERQKRIIATQKARNLKKTLDAHLAEAGRTAFRNFSTEEKECFQNMQKKILQNLEGGRPLKREITKRKEASSDAYYFS